MQVTRLMGTSWLVYDNGRGILIDTGLRTHEKAMLKKVDALGIDIPLIFLTHTHYDHTGCAEVLRKVTGAQVIVSAKEAGYLRSGHTPVPKGTGFFSNALSRVAHALQSKKRESYMPVEQDIIEIVGERTLEEYDFDARVIPLGAHTDGSIGLHIGDCFFAGDTVFGIGNIVYPMFANYPEQIQGVWQKILGIGAQSICPGHGRMLNAAVLKRHYKRQFRL